MLDDWCRMSDVTSEKNEIRRLKKRQDASTWFDKLTNRAHQPSSEQVLRNRVSKPS